MKLQRLTITNFMPFKGPISIDFPTDEHRNVMIVFGDNMRGKTSLLNAIRWGFYESAVGRHSRPISLHEIVNRDAALEGDWRVEVHIEFEADSHNYDLRRVATLRKHVASPSRAEDFSVAVHLTRDGIVISGDQVRSEIEQFAPEQVSRFFLFDGELLQQYEELLIEGSEQGRQIKESIEQVLGVPALINGRTQLGAIVKAATKRQSNEIALIHGLEKQAERQKELTARQDAFERDYQHITDKLSNVKKERIQYEDDLEAAATILSMKGQLDGARSRLSAQRDIRLRKQLERLALLSQAWHDVLAIKVDVKRAQLVAQQTVLTDGLKKQGRLQSSVENLLTLLRTKECPTCGQILDEAHKARLGAELGVMQGNLSRINDETGDLQMIAGQIASLSKIKSVNARDRLLSIDRDIRAADVETQKAENDIERLTDLISGHDTAELARKRSLHMELVREEGKLAGELQQIQKSIDKTKDELAVAQKTIQGLATARAQRSTYKVAIATDLEKTFAVSIERLRDRLRERVNFFANAAFKAMTTQKGYSGLEINKNYGLSILDAGGHRVPLRSAGAEQIVALSLIDGLNRTGRAVGPVVMDTPFGRLDLKHRDNILSYLPTVTSQFILLVHSGEIRPETDLSSIKARIGATYSIQEISPRQSKIVRTML